MLTLDGAPSAIREPTVRQLERFAATLATLDDDQWANPSRCAGWSSRDVFLPLGTTPDEEADEVAACLRYGAVLSPAFAANDEPDRQGRLVVEATDPSVSFAIDVAGCAAVHELDADDDPGGTPDAVFSGPAVELTEAFSRRRPLPAPAPAEAAWLLDGLATVFDQTDR